jgi:hypothetical protein
MNQTSRYIQIDIRGEVFNVLKCIGSKIPFIGSLIEASGDPGNEPIILDEFLSPLFFKILMNHLINEEKIDLLKENISRFDPVNVQKYLNYLGFTELYKSLYGSNQYNGSLVIENRLIIGTGVEKRRVYVMCDGTFLIPRIHRSGDPDGKSIQTIYVLVDAKECFYQDQEDAKEGDLSGGKIMIYLVKSKIDNQSLCVFQKNEIFKDGSLCYVRLGKAIEKKVVQTWDF